MVLPRWFGIVTIGATALVLGMPVLSRVGTAIRLEWAQPLEHPIEVVGVRPDGLLLEGGERCALAGVLLPEDPEALARALEFIELAVQKGVIIERRVDGDACMVRCAVFRANTHCGNAGPGSYTCESLNQLLLSFGFARFDGAASGLDEECDLLMASERRAQREPWGVWSPPGEARGPRRVGRGYDSGSFSPLAVW